MATCNFYFFVMLLAICTPWVIGLLLQLLGVISSYVYGLGCWSFVYVLVFVSIANRIITKQGEQSRQRRKEWTVAGNPLSLLQIWAVKLFSRRGELGII